MGLNPAYYLVMWDIFPRIKIKERRYEMNTTTYFNRYLVFLTSAVIAVMISTYSVSSSSFEDTVGIIGDYQGIITSSSSSIRG